MANILLVLFEGLVYATVMVALLHMRHVLGIGVFVAALGVMHFIETYLAAVFYVELPFGVVSPGSVVLFSGKLMMILLVYVTEDAATVRQPIYGLLAGNFLTVVLVMILQQHDAVAILPGRAPDIGFLNEMGWLMVWGTILLYLDSLLTILLYERLARFTRHWLTLRFLICGVVVLTFDQAGFFLALRWVNGAPTEVFWGGWIAKMGVAVFYAVLLGLYFRFASSAALPSSRLPLGDVFNTLTYRQRYEDLLSQSGRDALTGALDRGRFEGEAARLVRNGIMTGSPVSLLMVDADHFKTINDRFGHPEGDRVLMQLASVVQAGLRQTDHFYRYGGEEFVVLCEGLDEERSLARALELCRRVEAMVSTPDGGAVTVSIGVSRTPSDGATIKDLLNRADARLYEAKRLGRNRVV